MARNRVIYQSEALFMNKDASLLEGYKQLERVQSANYSYTINRQDVNQFGQLGKLDSIILDAPTVSADASYYVTDGYTERVLGFWVSYDGDGEGTDVSFVSGHLADGSGRNMVIVTTPEGTDVDLPSRSAETNDNSAIGIGNCYLSDYSVDLAVGAIPTVSVSFDALNINADQSAADIQSPAVNVFNGEPIGDDIDSLPTPITGEGSIAALRPGDITVNISEFDTVGASLVNIGTDAEGCHIQSASLSIPLSRSPLERLGTKTAYARSVDFPVVSTLSVSAIINETDTANLADLLDSEVEKEVTLVLGTSDGGTGVKYTLKGCSFDSESITSSIGANKSVDLSFSTSVGGPEDTEHGVFMSGVSIDRGNM